MSGAETTAPCASFCERANGAMSSRTEGLSLIVTCLHCGLSAATTRPDLARIVAMRHRLALAPRHRNDADTLRAAACLAAESGQAATGLLRALREDGALAPLTVIEAERYARALARSGIETQIEPPPYSD